MRSLLLGLLIAPAVWAVAGFGQAKLAEVTRTGLTVNTALLPLAVLAGAGLVFGLIAATRVSPLGPFFAALLLLGGQLAYLARPEKITALLPRSVLGVEGVLTMPATTGLATVLGTSLLLALLSLGRWRRWPKREKDKDRFQEPYYGDRPDAFGPSYPSQRDPYDDEPTAVGRAAHHSAPEESGRAFAGSPSGSEPPRYEAFGYVSEDPNRHPQATPGWGEPAEPTRATGWGEPAEPTRATGWGEPAEPTRAAGWGEPAEPTQVGSGWTGHENEPAWQPRTDMPPEPAPPPPPPPPAPPPSYGGPADPNVTPWNQPPHRY